MRQGKVTGTGWVEPGMGSTVSVLLKAAEFAGAPGPGDATLYTSLLLTGRDLEPIDERRIIDAVRSARGGKP